LRRSQKYSCFVHIRSVITQSASYSSSKQHVRT